MTDDSQGNGNFWDEFSKPDEEGPDDDLWSILNALPHGALEAYEEGADDPTEHHPYNENHQNHMILTACAGVASATCDLLFGISVYTRPSLVSISIFLVVFFGTFYATMLFARGKLKTAMIKIDLRESRKITVPDLIANKLEPGEKVWDITREDPIGLLRWNWKWALPVVAIVIGAWWFMGFSRISLAITAIALLPVAYRLLVWYNHIIIFTSFRVMDLAGVFSKGYKEAPYDKLMRVDFKVPAFEQWMAIFRITYTPTGEIRLGIPKDDEDDREKQALTEIRNLPHVEYHQRRVKQHMPRSAA